MIKYQGFRFYRSAFPWVVWIITMILSAFATGVIDFFFRDNHGAGWQIIIGTALGLLYWGGLGSIIGILLIVLFHRIALVYNPKSIVLRIVMFVVHTFNVLFFFSLGASRMLFSNNYDSFPICVWIAGTLCIWLLPMEKRKLPGS